MAALAIPLELLKGNVDNPLTLNSLWLISPSNAYMYIHICPLGFSLFCYLQLQHSFDYAQFVGVFVYFLPCARTVLVVNSISVASMMDIDAEDNKAKVEDMVAMMIVVNDDHSRDNEKAAKDNEKGAKEVVAKNNAYCHGSSTGGYKKPAAPAAAASGARSRAKPRAAGKKASSSSSTNPYEFYYYSGFGPLWSKRRGDRSGGEGGRNGGENSIVAESENVVIAIAPSTTDDVAATNNNDTIQGGVVVGSCSEMDYVDIDDEEEDDGNGDESGKKRTRKPVKARSLKSLM